METAPSGGAGTGCYADSVDSMSPRSRGGESWDEPFAPSAAAQAAAASSKLRLMCSYGGHIMPRPHDKTLCYLGGETRIVVIDRHSTLADLHARLSRSLLGGRSFCLKYQLPSEDLDSLISVTTDEDLDNMIEEYDRIVAAAAGGGAGTVPGGVKSSRLRLFLFPAKPESAGPSSSIGSLLDDSKSETWFVDALNGTMLGRNLSSADSTASSVNCLLGLDDSNPSPNGAGVGGVPPDSDPGVLFPCQDSSGKLGGGSRPGGQDVHSVPDSPKASSFGSASSTPSLSNLPPIRVRPDDRGPDLRAISAGLEDHFSQMNISGEQKQPQQHFDAGEGFHHHLQYYPPPPPQPINPTPLAARAPTGSTPTNISPTEYPNSGRVFSSDDDKSEPGGFRRSLTDQQSKEQQQTQQQQQQQQKPNLVDMAMSGDAVSRPMFYPERPVPASDIKQEAPVADPSYRLPVHVTDQGYLVQPPLPLPSMQAVEQLQQQPQLQQQQQQQTQQQFIPANPHLLHHHHASGTAIPLPSYYQMPIHPQQQLPKAAHPYNSQVPMFFVPLRQNPPYNLAMQPGFGDAATAGPIPSAGKPTIPMPSTVLPSRVAPPKPELTASVYRAAVSGGATIVQPPQPTQLIHFTDQPPQYVSYHPMHHHPSQAAAGAGYGYEYADAVHTQQMYYTQAATTALPPQYQTMSSGAGLAESPPALQQPAADVKQARAS